MRPTGFSLSVSASRSKIPRSYSLSGSRRVKTNTFHKPYTLVISCLLLLVCAACHISLASSSRGRATLGREPPTEASDTDWAAARFPVIVTLDDAEYNSLIGLNSFEHDNLTTLLVGKFSELFEGSAGDLMGASSTVGGSGDTESMFAAPIEYEFSSDLQHSLETRAEDVRKELSEPPTLHARNYFRVLNKVFSRLELPESFKAPSRSTGAFCANHIGCLDEIPNIPSLLKRVNISTLFTVYTPPASGEVSTEPKSKFVAHRILYEPIQHYQLEDDVADVSELDKLSRQSAQAISSSSSGRQQRPKASSGVSIANPRRPTRARLTASSWVTAAKIKRSQEYPFDLSAIERCIFNASRTTRVIVGGYFAKEDEEWIDQLIKQWMLMDPQSNIIKVSWSDANRGLYHSAAYNSRVVGRHLTLFIHYLDQMFSIDPNKFQIVGHSLGAHIAGSVGADLQGKLARITGLDPAGPIFVDLDSSLRLDPSDAKFVDVVHTNGGPITKGALGLTQPSGHVDYYINGGSVQPGCYLSSVSTAIMDPVERVACSHRRSYRYMIEIIRATVNEQDQMMSTMSSQQRISSSRPTSSTSRMSKSRREMQARMMQLQSKRPRAFLFEAKLEELERLSQPDLLVVSQNRKHSASVPLTRRVEFHLLQPQWPVGKRGLYYIRTRPESPFFAGKQYALTLRSEATIRRKMTLAFKLDNLSLPDLEVDELDSEFMYSFVLEPSESHNLIWYKQTSDMLNQPASTRDQSDQRSIEVPKLSLMWRSRSTFNLLQGSQQNELRLTSIDLNELESTFEAIEMPTASNVDIWTVNYAWVSNSNSNSKSNSASQTSHHSHPQQPAAMALHSESPASHSLSQVIRFDGSDHSNTNSTSKSQQLRQQLGSSRASELSLVRNKWYKLDGRVAILSL